MRKFKNILRVFKRKEPIEKLRRFQLYAHDLEFENFLFDFLKEIGCQRSEVAWKFTGPKLYLYTNTPGRIIGKAGCNISLLKQRSKEKLRSYQWVDDVVINEIRGVVPKSRWTQKEIDEILSLHSMEDCYE